MTKSSKDRKVDIQGLVQDSAAGIFVSTFDGQFVFANQTMAEMFEFDSLQELIAAGSIGLYRSEADRNAFLEELRRTGRVEGLELDGITNKGRAIKAVISATLYGDLISGVLSDISQRRKAELGQLRAVRERDVLLDLMNDGLLVVNADEKITDCNPAQERLMGIPKEDLLGTTITELLQTYIAPDCLDVEMHKHMLTWPSTEPRQDVLQIIDRDGRKRSIAYSSASLCVPGGGHEGKILTMRDVTELKQAEEELRLSRENFRHLFNNAQVGVYRTRIDGSGILDYNKKFKELTGYSDEELRHMPTVIKWADPQARVELITKLQQDGVVTDHEIKLIKKDDSVVTCLVSCKVYPDKGYLEGTLMDITERKQAELKLHKLNEELQRSNDDLESFAYVASHDLQEPLRMVTSYVQLLEKRYTDKLDDSGRDFIAFAVDGAQWMKTLITDLLAFSRVNTMGCSFDQVEIQTVIQRACDLLRSQIEGSGAEVIVDSKDLLPTVFGDRSQLIQLFQNLINNAIRFRGEEPPQVQVTAKKQDGEWLFAIKDNGLGIESQYRERIFQIFQRLHTRQQYPGTGTGLAICKKIVERHGGRIWLKSVPGKGSTFFFTIPSSFMGIKL